MSNPQNVDVCIVGGGPIGLCLGCRLLDLGISFKILEKEEAISGHSRAVGIHPPSLEFFHDLGISRRFIDKGIKIKTGNAIVDNRLLGKLSFQSCPKPYNFILSLPQNDTERILETFLNSKDPALIDRGVTVVNYELKSDSVRVFGCGQSNDDYELNCKYLIGCDGKSSTIRTLAKIDFPGRSYPHTFAMGDFDDNTDFGPEAAVYLHGDGVVESFPLPENRRRWVVKTREYMEVPEQPVFCDLVRSRTGIDLDGQTPYMMSSFGVQKYLASSFIKGRIFLAGDAAHIISPFGGQGMNLGWMDAWDIASLIHQIENKNRVGDGMIETCDLKMRRRVRKAIRRAEFNMLMGRERNSTVIRDFFVRTLLRKPFSNYFLKVFTMRGL